LVLRPHRGDKHTHITLICRYPRDRCHFTLRGEKAIVEVTRRHATGVGDDFNKGVILTVKSIEDKPGELVILHLEIVL
jgi:hypothetical protein